MDAKEVGPVGLPQPHLLTQRAATEDVRGVGKKNKSSIQAKNNLETHTQEVKKGAVI